MDFDETDNIREPDFVRTERLQEDTRSDYERQVDDAIQLSIHEMHQQHRIYAQYEKQLLEDYAKETVRRSELFTDFLFNLNKLSRFDKKIGEVLDIINPIIESYCSQIIEVCELDEATYNKIFGALRGIRNCNSGLDALKSLIVIQS